MDLPITSKSRALILRYEHLRPIDESIARETVKQSGAGGADWDVVSCVLHSFNAAVDIRKQREQEWAWAFRENERFADALLKKERECGVPDLPIHLFGCAPLVLMLHLGWCLSRRPLFVYQQDDVKGTWSLGYSRDQASADEAFFEIEGLPRTKQEGRGQVALVIEVTNPIWDEAIADLRVQHPAELLAMVRLRPSRGIGRNSVRGPRDIASAMGQLRDVLDTLHELLIGAESILLVMNCPGSMAAAFGSAINPHTQHPLGLHQYNDDSAGRQRYLRVYQLRHQQNSASIPTAELSQEQWKEVLETLQEVKRVYAELEVWMAQPKQKPLMALLGETALSEYKINGIPATDERPSFRHLRGDWSFHASLLRRFHALQSRLETSQWDECVRLFLLHEIYHIQQEGLDSYTYQGVGQAGWVLEAVDYDADVVSMEIALAWRNKGKPSASRDSSRAEFMGSIIWNALESVRIFEPEWPIRELSERRLRRYVIWLFHACRLSLRPSKTDTSARLDRVMLEFTGLPTTFDRRESYPQFSVRLEDLDRAGNMELALYFRHKLVRDKDNAWIRDLLLAIIRWEDHPRKKAQDMVCALFERLFKRYPSLLTQG